MGRRRIRIRVVRRHASAGLKSIPVGQAISNRDRSLAEAAHGPHPRFDSCVDRCGSFGAASDLIGAHGPGSRIAVVLIHSATFSCGRSSDSNIGALWSQKRGPQQCFPTVTRSCSTGLHAPYDSLCVRSSPPAVPSSRETPKHRLTAVTASCRDHRSGTCAHDHSPGGERSHRVDGDNSAERSANERSDELGHSGAGDGDHRSLRSPDKPWLKGHRGIDVLARGRAAAGTDGRGGPLCRTVAGGHGQHPHRVRSCAHLPTSCNVAEEG